MRTLILAAHGSKDPRSSATTHAVAEHVRRLRPWLDVRIAFCEQASPHVGEVLADVGHDAVVAPLLLADAYHANVDIPAVTAASGLRVRQAGVLGEDPRLLAVMHRRLAEIGVSRFDEGLGVVVVAVGSSYQAANTRTSTLAGLISAGTRWAGTEVAFATGSNRTVAEAAESLRAQGATRLVVAPWFLASGRITDRVAAHRIPMAMPLGAHPLVAELVLHRFDQAIAHRAAA